MKWYLKGLQRQLFTFKWEPDFSDNWSLKSGLAESWQVNICLFNTHVLLMEVFFYMFLYK